MTESRSGESKGQDNEVIDEVIGEVIDSREKSFESTREVIPQMGDRIDMEKLMQRMDSLEKTIRQGVSMDATQRLDALERNLEKNLRQSLSNDYSEGMKKLGTNLRMEFAERTQETIARVDGLAASLEFTQGEVEDLKGDASEHRIHSNCLAEAVGRITTKLDVIKAQNYELQRKAVKRDDYTWKSNLLLIGIPENKGENCDAEVRGTFCKKLKMQKE